MAASAISRADGLCCSFESETLSSASRDGSAGASGFISCEFGPADIEASELPASIGCRSSSGGCDSPLAYAPSGLTAGVGCSSSSRRSGRMTDASGRSKRATRVARDRGSTPSRRSRATNVRLSTALRDLRDLASSTLSLASLRRALIETARRDLSAGRRAAACSGRLEPRSRLARTLRDSVRWARRRAVAKCLPATR